MSVGLFRKTVLGAVVFITAASASAQTADQWLAGLQPEPGVLNELGKFQGLPADYIQSLPSLMKQKMTSEMDQALGEDLNQQSCHPSLNISFLKQVTPASQNSRSVSDFESQFIRIEMKSCLPQISAARAAQVYLSADYQRRAFDTVVAHNQNGARVCQATEATGLGRSEYCYNNSVLAQPEGTLIHSYNDWNQNGVAAPVYYREMLTASYQLPQGTMFYTLVYVRGVDIPSLFKSFAKSKIAASQKKAIELLSSMAK
jgi:hypothetical protein